MVFLIDKPCGHTALVMNGTNMLHMPSVKDHFGIASDHHPSAGWERSNMIIEEGIERGCTEGAIQFLEMIDSCRLFLSSHPQRGIEALHIQMYI